MFQQMFDPTAASKLMQQFTDFGQFNNSQKQSETVQKICSVWSEAFTNYSKQQAEMFQSAVSDSIACMREIGTAKSPEEAVQTQASWTKKWTETCQSNAQQLASTVQKAQTQCTDLISKLVSENIEATKSATKQATNAVNNATKNS